MELWGGAGVKSFLGRGALAGVATWAGEKAIDSGLDAFNSKLDEWFPEIWNPESRARAAGHMGDEGTMPSLLDNFRTLLQELNVDRTGDGSQDGAAWDALRELPNQTAELDHIRGLLAAQPNGTQDVNVTNPTRPNVTVNNHISVTTNASPDEIGRAVGDRVRAAAEGYMSDGGM